MSDSNGGEGSKILREICYSTPELKLTKFDMRDLEFLPELGGNAGGTPIGALTGAIWGVWGSLCTWVINCPLLGKTPVFKLGIAFLCHTIHVRLSSILQYGVCSSPWYFSLPCFEGNSSRGEQPFPQWLSGWVLCRSIKGVEQGFLYMHKSRYEPVQTHLNKIHVLD